MKCNHRLLSAFSAPRNVGVWRCSMMGSVGCRRISSATLGIKDLEMHSSDLKTEADFKEAARIYKEHGCLVVRGLNKEYVGRIQKDAEHVAKQSLSLLDRAEKIPEGWLTPDGTLFIKANKEGFGRDKQIMVLGLDYFSSSALLDCARDKTTLGVLEQIIGPNIELFGKGQCLYKEPTGGFPKLLHQDNAYFEFLLDGPVGTLNYAVDTSEELNNGPLYVVPGTHKHNPAFSNRKGAYDGLTNDSAYVKHVDTFSHLGLPEDEWSFEEAIPVNGKAGDTLFFHINCVHGSTPNFSSEARPTFINRYISPEDEQLIFATSEEMRENARKDLEEKKLQSNVAKERGYMILGTRQFNPDSNWKLEVAHH